MDTMITFLKKYGSYIFGMGAEKVFIVGGVLMTWRAITGKVLGHKMSSRERVCYALCGICDLLSFFVPLMLYKNDIIYFWHTKHREMQIWYEYGTQLMGMSYWYILFTSLGWVFYLFSKPSQIKKARKHFRC